MPRVWVLCLALVALVFLIGIETVSGQIHVLPHPREGGDDKGGANSNSPPPPPSSPQKGRTVSEYVPSSSEPSGPRKSAAPRERTCRFLLRDRKAQAWRVMDHNGQVPSIWNSEAELMILIHSYSNAVSRESMTIIRDQGILDIGLEYGSVYQQPNIIVVDWTSAAVQQTLRYTEAVKGVSKAGREVAELLIALKKYDKLQDWKEVHIVGFGMGAHIGGIAGNAIQRDLPGVRLGRITGLDPVAAEFDDPSEDGEKRYLNEFTSLGKSDADFVDIIHCNMGFAKSFQEAMTRGRYGTAVQAGHVDIYPFGGETQPGCSSESEKLETACSHRKCTDYFARSINFQNYTACRCDDWEYIRNDRCSCTLETTGIRMGVYCDEQASGRYYVKKENNK